MVSISQQQSSPVISYSKRKKHDTQTITAVGLPPHCSSELPLQAERATPYLSTIVASEDLLNTIRLGFISTLIGSCLAKPLLNQTCSRRAQGPVKP